MQVFLLMRFLTMRWGLGCGMSSCIEKAAVSGGTEARQFVYQAPSAIRSIGILKACKFSSQRNWIHLRLSEILVVLSNMNTKDGAQYDEIRLKESSPIGYCLFACVHQKWRKGWVEQLRKVMWLLGCDQTPLVIV